MNLTDNRGPHVISAVMACSVLARLALAGRITARKMLKAEFLVSDYLVAMGLLGAWLLSGLTVWGVKLGLGRHVQVVPVGNLEILLKTEYVQEICYSISLPLIKISILLFYRSIFLGKVFDMCTYATGAFVIAWGIAVLPVAIFTCHPISDFWYTRMEHPRFCINNKVFFIANSSLNILGDVMILCLPMRDVWNLQMSRKSKAAVSGMLFMGGCVIVASCLRLKFLLGFNETDFTWNEIKTLLWGCVEVNVAVVSACLPTMGPVLQAILQSSFLVKILGTRETAGLKDPLNRPARNERDEEFHRLPEHGIDRSLGPEAQHTYDSSVRLEDMHWEGRARKNGKEITSIESGENDV